MIFGYFKYKKMSGIFYYFLKITTEHGRNSSVTMVDGRGARREKGEGRRERRWMSVEKVWKYFN